MILIYLILLIIAPQLWIEPFVGIPVDMFLYPIWFLVITVKGRLNEFFNFNRQDTFFFMFIIWLILSAFANPRHGLTNHFIIEYIKMFLLYRLIVVTIDSDEDFIRVVKALLVLVLVIAVEAIQHKYDPAGLGWAGQKLGWVDKSVIEAGGTGRTQWINIFDGPGVFCVLFTTALPFALRYLDKHNSKMVKFFGLLIVSLLIFAIWTTGSRGGFLATMAILGVYGMVRMKVTFMTMVKVGSLLIFAYMAAPSHLTSVKDSNKSAQHRVDMWVQGIEMVQQNPVFGIGKGNFASYTGTLIAHNSAIEIMGELGIPGLFFWIGITYMAFKSLSVIIKTGKDPGFNSLMTAVAITLIGYIVSSMFVTLEYETLYFILALPRSVIRYKKINLEFTTKDLQFIMAIMLGFYLALKVFVILYY